MTALIAVIVLVAANGFFVATEFALVSVRSSRIDELVATGVRGARSVRSAVAELDRYIAGTQIGITIASLALGWIGEPAIAGFVEPVFAYFSLSQSPTVIHTVSVIISFAVITTLHVVLGELVPKSLALQMPEKVALLVAKPMALTVMTLQPLIICLNGIGNLILRAMGMEPASEHHNVHSAEELQILVRQSHQAGVLDDAERKIIQRTFRFSELSASEIMTSRMDIKSLDIRKAEGELWDDITKSNHSRFPVHDGSPDNIIGIVHLSDLLKNSRLSEPKPLREILKPALILPEQVAVGVILENFQKQRTQISIIVDEHGSTSGLVTLQDIVEEVFGELQDVGGTKRPRFTKDSAGGGSIDGKVRLDEIKEEFGWVLQDDEVDTIAGYIMKRLGRIPRIGDLVETEAGDLVVEEMLKRGVTRVGLKPRKN